MAKRHLTSVGSAIADAIEPPAESEPGDAGPVAVVDDRERMPANLDPRQAIVDVLRERLEAVLQPVEDTALWAGVLAITRKDLNAVLTLPLPEASGTAAAVRTPAYVSVSAVCPRCWIPVDALLVLNAELTVKPGNVAKIKVKAESGATPHVCGQKRLAVVEPERPVPGQQALPDGATEDEPADAELAEPPSAAAVPDQGSHFDLGSCPFPGCPLAAEHPGEHGDGIDLDDDLLPL